MKCYLEEQTDNRIHCVLGSTRNPDGVSRKCFKGASQ